MNTKHSDRLDRTEPAFIVKYGNTGKKYLSLQRNGSILGRARGCDIELDSPEVSGVHCVVTRGPAGLYIRDCASRMGTKVNGAKVHDALLHNGDIVQIGSFSFEVYLPWKVTPSEGGGTVNFVYKQQVKRLQHSRERLVRLAMGLRRRLRAERPAAHDSSVETVRTQPSELKNRAQDQAQREQALAARQAELDRLTAALQAQLREHEQRLAVHADAERGLAARQAGLDQQAADLRDQVRAREQDAKQLEEDRRRFLAEQSSTPTPSLEESERVAQRRQELERRTQQLHQNQQRLDEWEQRLRQVESDQENDRQEMLLEHDRLAAYKAELEGEKAVTVRETSELEEQRSLLTGALEELQHLSREIQERRDAELETLRQTNDRLLELCRRHEAKQAPLPEPAPPQEDRAPQEAPNAKYLAEITALRRQLDDKETLFQKLNEQPKTGPEWNKKEIESIEVELAAHRRQLEAERQTFDEEVRQFKERNTEIEETARQTELELSRDRAQLAHERARMTHMREEIRQEVERFHRDPELCERLARLQRTRHELAGRPGSDPSLTPTPLPNKNRLAERLNSVLGRSGDASK